MTLQKSYPPPSLSSTPSLDTLVSSAIFFAARWHPDLKRNQSRDVLRLLIYKLFAPRGGSWFHRHARCSHSSLAESLALSREWTCTLIGRLRDAGWIETHAPRLPNGQQEISLFKPGKMLKRLLVLLFRSKQRSQKHRVNDSSQKIPTKEDVEKNKALLANLIAELGQKFTPKKDRTG